MAPVSPTGVAATPAAPHAASHVSRSVTRRFTRTVSGGRALPASRMASQSSGHSRRTRSIHQSGYEKRATGSARTASSRVSRSRR